MSTGHPQSPALPRGPEPLPLLGRPHAPTRPPALRTDWFGRTGRAWWGAKDGPGRLSSPSLVRGPRGPTEASSARAICPLPHSRPLQRPARLRPLWPAGRVGPFTLMALHCGAACQLHPAVTSVGRRLWGWSPGLPQRSLRPSQQSLLGASTPPLPPTPCSSHSCPGGQSPRSCSPGPAPPGPSLGPRSVLPAPLPAPAQPCCLGSGVSLSRDHREAVSPTRPSRLPRATPC